MKIPFFVLMYLLTATITTAQTFQELFAQSTQAYEKQDFKSFLSLTQRLDSLRPSHPTITYNLAGAYALNQQTDKALATLEKLVLMNNTVEFEKDADFSSLQNLDGYKAILQLKKDLSVTLAQSKKVIELNEKTLHPEGLIYLPKAKLWLATSIRKRKIVSFDIATGECADWLAEADVLAIFAAKADKNEKYLWAATSAIPNMENFTKNDDGKGEILKIDLKTKKIVQRFTIEGQHVWGDLCVAANGDVYVSDSKNPIIYKIGHKQKKMQEWLNLSGQAVNLQGITLDEKNETMFVADYLKGILKITVAQPKQHTWLPMPNGFSQKGIDGLVWHQQTLIAIHNGIAPIRIAQYTLNFDKTALEKGTLIDLARPELNEPTLLTVVGNAIYFVGNAPWAFYAKDFSLDGTKLEKPTIYTFELK